MATVTEKNVMAGTTPAVEGAMQPGVTKVKLNGKSKTIAGNAPLTGQQLHQLAGFPDKLVTASGEEVPNEHEEFKYSGDLELVTKHDLSGADAINPEHVLAPSGPKVDPPHADTVSGIPSEDNTVIVAKKK